MGLITLVFPRQEKFRRPQIDEPPLFAAYTRSNSSNIFEILTNAGKSAVVRRQHENHLQAAKFCVYVLIHWVNAQPCRAYRSGNL